MTSLDGEIGVSDEGGDYLGHVDDDVTGGVDDEHQVVPASQAVRPAAPVLDGPIGQHLLGVVRNVNPPFKPVLLTWNASYIFSPSLME